MMMDLNAPAAQDESELEAMAETELVRLKRQYRIMENDRMAYAGEANNQLRSQKLIIEKLESEKCELVVAIKAAKSFQNAQKDDAMTERLDELLKKRADFIEQIKKEKRQLAEIDEQIVKLSKEVHSLRTKVVTDVQIKETTNKYESNIRILENRLEVSTQRFNALVTGNTSLRQEIDGLLKDRARFNAMWAKLNGQMSLGKSVINDLIEQAIMTYNQRDEELNKIVALRERGQRDLRAHTGEMCELQRTIDNEMKLHEFLGVKGQYREMSDLNAKLAAEREAKKEEMRNKVATYNHILEVVRSFTGETEVTKLTGQFLKQEEENFALFNYCNELNDELEGLQTRVAELRKAIDEARVMNVHRGQKQADTLDSIAKDLQEQTERTKRSEESLIEVNATMDKLLSGIEELFKSIGCDDSPILQLLGNNSKVNVNNVMLHLNIIEKRLTEMLGKVYWVDNKTTTGQNNREPQQQQQPTRLNADDRKSKLLQRSDYSSVVTPCPL